MPKSVVDKGLADTVMPINKIADAIAEEISILARETK
jgi:chemotaxis response regulator CheB